MVFLLWFHVAAGGARGQIARYVRQSVAAEVAHVHTVLLSAAADGAGAEAIELALALRDYWDVDDLPLSSLQALQQVLQQAKEQAQEQVQEQAQQPLPGHSNTGVSDDSLNAAKRCDLHELLAFGFGSAGLMAAAQAHAEAAQAAAEAADDDACRARALGRAVWVRYCGGQLNAVALVQQAEQAVVLARRAGHGPTLAFALRVLAGMHGTLTLNWHIAEPLLEEAQRLWEQAGHRALARLAWHSRATTWAWSGRNEQALPVMHECERMAHQEGDWAGLVVAARQQGRVLIRLRRWPLAVQAFGRALHVAWQRRYARGLANTLLNLPEALFWAGEDEAAALLHGFALAHWARLYGTINRIEMAEAKRTRRLLRLRLRSTRAEALRLQGAGLTLPAAVALALRSIDAVGVPNTLPLATKAAP